MSLAVRARSIWIGTASALVIGGVLPTTAVAGTEADAGAPRWAAAKLPGDDAVLSQSVKPDAHTTWAAGFKIVQEGEGIRFLPVVYTQDDRRGPAWKELPTAPGVEGRINALATTSPSDTWVVGDAEGEAGPVMTQHWNGRSWDYRPAPMQDNSLGGGLLGISALAPNDVWAVGWTQVLDERIPDPDGGPTQIVDHHEGLVQHWDGRAWNRVAVPQPFANWALSGISASGPNDIWAVGNGYGDDDTPVIMHYDGRTWTALPTPPYGGLYGEFNDVVANGPRDVWAVGRTLLDEDDRGHALVMHWDGRTWKRFDTPADAGPLTGVAKTPGGIVAVGQTHDRESGYGLRVAGTQVTSLGIPATAGGTAYSPWKVSATSGNVLVAGTFNYAKADFPKPMLLTTRL